VKALFVRGSIANRKHFLAAGNFLGIIRLAESEETVPVVLHLVQFLFINEGLLPIQRLESLLLLVLGLNGNLVRHLVLPFAFGTGVFGRAVTYFSRTR